MSIIDTLQIPVKDRTELPTTYKPLTVPISVYDTAMITSMWSTMRYAPVVATLQDGALVFWRQKLESVGKVSMKKVRTQ